MRAALVAALGAALGGAALAGPAATSPAAVGIGSISPAVADRGGTVSITGNDFGGPNVKITVGGDPVELLSATGSRATGAYVLRHVGSGTYRVLAGDARSAPVRVA
jgi:hypothetical protein